MIGKYLLTLTLFSSLLVCESRAATLTSAPFGKTRAGVSVTKFRMSARNGVSVSFMTYGGTVLDVAAPDHTGRLGHVVLGFPKLIDYETTSAQKELYFGAILGRYSNWLDQGQFKLDGHLYQITLTDPPNTIHGGKVGFDKQVWSVGNRVTSGKKVSARLSYVSPDGQEGFPGRLEVHVTYSLTDDGVFTIDYEAVSNKDTVLSLTNHMNFNMAGAGSPGGIVEQVLGVDADQYLPLDEKQIPLGTIDPVAATPFDFRLPSPIGAHIHDNNKQLAIAGGYDQYWILNKRGSVTRPQLAAHVLDPQSGRTLDCYTTEPGVGIYTADWFDGSVSGIGGRYDKYAAFTLETQRFPNAPNQPNFPSTVLKPGEIFHSTTIFRFGIVP